MAEAKPFKPVKAVCGIIFGDEIFLGRAKEKLIEALGPVDAESPIFPFEITSYYENEMGGNLKRLFLSFSNLIRPERLSAIKVFTNDLEEKVRVECGQSRRVLNVDPGYLTVSALVMATTKDFSHRIPLEYGIYAHLEFLFSKTGIRVLDWTYPDFRKEDYRQFFLSVRKLYMTRLKEMGLG